MATHANFGALWTPRGFTPVAPGLTPGSGFGLLIAMCIAQAGSLFAADAWNNVTFTAGEVREPQRNLPRSLALGTMMVTGRYCAVNMAYLLSLPFEQVQRAAADRVAGAMLASIWPVAGPIMISIAIMVSTFGCMNGMLMSGARTYYAMAKDGVFFERAAALNRAHVPGASLVMQGAWAALLVLLRTCDPSTGAYGNLYSNLPDSCGYRVSLPGSSTGRPQSLGTTGLHRWLQFGPSRSTRACNTPLLGRPDDHSARA